jgi:hypothetical protein
MIINRKRGQGLSLNMIIIAAISLVVLFVVISIFTGQTKQSVKTLESCPGKGGQCKPDSCSNGELKITNAKCDSDNDICCIKISENG